MESRKHKLSPDREDPVDIKVPSKDKRDTDKDVTSAVSVWIIILSIVQSVKVYIVIVFFVIDTKYFFRCGNMREWRYK